MARIEEIHEEEVPPPKVNNASLGELKATSDDAIAPYMESLNFVQSHFLSDIRLAMGYTAVIACAAAAYYEYKVGFQEAKSWNILAVVTYFTLNSALYLWGWFIEGETVYVGRKGDVTLEVSTSVEKYDPTYNVVFRMFKTKDATQLAHITAKKSFASWFDAEGTFVKKPFDNWLGDNVISVESQLKSGKKKK